MWQTDRQNRQTARESIALCYAETRDKNVSASITDASKYDNVTQMFVQSEAVMRFDRAAISPPHDAAVRLIGCAISLFEDDRRLIQQNVRSLELSEMCSDRFDDISSGG